MSSLDTVWNQVRYESGLYDCKVQRDGQRGVLTITLLGLIDHLLHRETVKVDRADADLWRIHCVNVITDPDKRTIEP